MVVFTCNNCGDSVKKPRVDKHLSFECKLRAKQPSLCCVDCLQDFDFETYQAHTKCLTEEQRYSAPGFVPKPSSNKGERKQTSWLDVVRSVLNKPDLSQLQKQLLMSVSHLDNIPRKKPRFMNFIQNSMNMRAAPKVVEEVFHLLDSEFKVQSTPEKKTEENEKKKEVSGTEGAFEEKNEFPVENGEGDSTVVKKKKKKKKEKSHGIDHEPVKSDAEGNSEPSKETMSATRDSEVVENRESPNMTEEVTKKKKKKKDKSEKVEPAITNGVTNAAVDEKSHSLLENEEKNESIGNDISFQNRDETFPERKSHKKKHKKIENHQDEIPQPDMNGHSEPMDCETAECIPEEEVTSEKVSKKKKKKKEKNSGSGKDTNCDNTMETDGKINSEPSEETQPAVDAELSASRKSRANEDNNFTIVKKKKKKKSNKGAPEADADELSHSLKEDSKMNESIINNDSLSNADEAFTQQQKSRGKKKHKNKNHQVDEPTQSAENEYLENTNCETDVVVPECEVNVDKPSKKKKKNKRKLEETEIENDVNPKRTCKL